jgi:hypothetical protein
MASLFTPDVPQQDPKVAQQQRDEQRRAEAARLRETQQQLGVESRIRNGGRGPGSGFRSLLGSFGSGNSPLGSG